MKKPRKTRLALLAAGVLCVSLIVGLTLIGNSGDDNPLDGATLYVDRSNNAAKQLADWRKTRPEAAAQLAELASQPIAKWLTSNQNLDELDSYLHGAAQAKASAMLVVYNIPLRDCGLYSAGGVDSANQYRQYVDMVAAKLKAARSDNSAKTIVILEPDALASMRTVRNGKACLTPAQRQERYDLLKYGVSTLKQVADTIVYIDAGNSAWVQDSGEIGRHLEAAGVQNADGFSLNVSNFQTTVDSEQYGQKISDTVGGKHFVIDTSRNGNGPYENSKYPDYTWCNPPGRALGHYPTTDTGQPRVDAYLYVKIPGESDGQDPDPQKCFDGPPAGQWNADYALGLIKRWPKELQPR